MEFDSHDSSMTNNNVLSNKNFKHSSMNAKYEQQYNPYPKIMNNIIQNEKSNFDKIGITLSIAIEHLQVIELVNFRIWKIINY